ncbi:unnamed protein product [Pedinophyceae sp. YPF-701]|nr:unnamed protein product [Pedinophyceae sp. YPF-701]
MASEEFGQQDAAGIAELHNLIKELRLKYKVARPGGDAAFAKQLDKSVKEILTRARTAVSASDDDFAVRAVQQLMRKDLVDTCSDALADMMRLMKLRDLADLLVTLKESYSGIVDDWKGLMEEQDKALASQQNEEAHKLRADLEAEKALHASLTVEMEELRGRLRARDDDVARLEKQTEDLAGQVEKGSAEAAQMTERLAALQAVIKGKGVGQPETPRATMQGANVSFDGAGYSRATPVAPTSTGLWATGSPSHAGGSPNGGGRGKHTPGGRSQPSGGLSSSSLLQRELTRGKLKALIREIIATKERSDELAAEGKQPRATMEEHVYAHMNMRYGLPSLVEEHVEALLAGVRQFEQADHEVALFGKILSNEVAEEFLAEMQSLAESVVGVLEQLVQVRHPGKLPAERAAEVRRRVGGELPLEEATVILRQMQDAAMREAVNAELTRRIEARVVEVAPSEHTRTSPGTVQRPTSVPFAEFLQIILEKHVARYEAAVAPAVQAFRQVDAVGSGVLSDDQFRQFCQLISPDIKEAEVDALLDLLDPRGFKRVTFSSCISTLARELPS